MMRADRRGILGVMLAAMVAVMVTCAWMPEAALAQADCRDAVTGIGTLSSSFGSGKAAFAFAAGYRTPTSPLAGLAGVVDFKAGFSMRSLSVDTYGGFHCFGATGPCYDRIFTGQAQVRWPGFSGVVPYQIEVIDWGPDAPDIEDYIFVSSWGFVAIGLINRGTITVHNPSTAEGCQ